MVVQKIFDVSASLTLVNKGTGSPAWYPDGWEDRSNWWYDGTFETDYFYQINSDNDECYIQYGQNQSQWASARFFGERVQVINEVQNSDRSLTVTADVTPLLFCGQTTEFAASVNIPVTYSVKINGDEVYSFSGNTIDTIENDEGTTITVTKTLAPQQQWFGTSMTIDVHYPDGTYPDSTVDIGFSLFNPNPIEPPEPLGDCEALRCFNDENIKPLECNISMIDACDVKSLISFLADAFKKIWCMFNKIINEICDMWDAVNTLRGAEGYESTSIETFTVRVDSSKFKASGATLSTGNPNTSNLTLDVSKAQLKTIKSVVAQPKLLSMVNGASSVSVWNTIEKTNSHQIQFAVSQTSETPQSLDVVFTVIGTKEG